MLEVAPRQVRELRVDGPLRNGLFEVALLLNAALNDLVEPGKDPGNADEKGGLQQQQVFSQLELNKTFATSPE